MKYLRLNPILIISGLLTTGNALATDEVNQTESDQDDNERIGYITTERFDGEVLSSDVPVLIDFTAEWCGPCRILDPVVESLMPDMSGRAIVFKVDTDDSPEIAKNLNVSQLPTVIFFGDGQEIHRTSILQPREFFVQYLEGLIRGESKWEITTTLLGEDWFRRHFLLKEGIEVIGETLKHYPSLLSDTFANGQTPLSVLLNFPGALYGYNRLGLLDLVMEQDPVLGTNELVGLGRCEEFKKVVENDPESVNRPDPDGITPLFTAVLQAPLLKDGGCLTEVVEAGASRELPSHIRNSLGRSVSLEYDDELLNEILTREWNTEFDDKDRGAGWRAFYRPMALLIDLKKSDLLESFSND